MAQDSKIPATLFGATLAMALVVVGAWLVGESDSAQLAKSAAPTSWAIPHPSYPTMYGAWPYPAFFALYFIYVFHDWFLRKEDLQRFQQLLLERKTVRAEDQE